MILVFLWASERWDGSLALRIFDELCEPFQLRFFSLRTQDPECCYPLIPWSLRLEEAPSPLVGPKPFFEIAAQFSGLSRSEEHTSELQSHVNLVCRLLLEKKKS